MSEVRLGSIRACVFDAYGTLFDGHSAPSKGGSQAGPTGPVNGKEGPRATTTPRSRIVSSSSDFPPMTERCSTRLPSPSLV